MSGDFKAIISEKSSRYKEWLEVMGTNEIPLIAPIAVLSSAPGIDEARFFLMDIAALTSGQRERLVKHLASKFSVPLEEVAHDLESVGCPILDEDVMLVIGNPQKWF